MPDEPTKMRFDITTVRANGEAWSEQLDLIRGAGAQFDPDTQQWFLWVDTAELRPEPINDLFQAAARFGTRIALHRPT